MRGIPRRVAGVIAACAAVMLLAGCQTTNYKGSGPLTLSPSQTRFLQSYLKEGKGVVFAITEDGRYGSYRYCPSGGQCYTRDEQYFTIQGCETGAKRPCKVLAVGQRIVWEGPVTDSDGKLLNP